MHGKSNSQWLDFSGRFVEPMINLNKIMINTAERLTSKQIDVAQDHFDFWHKQIKILAEIKDKPASLTEEGKLVAGYGNKIIERTDEFLQIASDTRQSLIGFAADNAVAATRGENQKSRVTSKAA